MKKSLCVLTFVLTTVFSFAQKYIPPQKDSQLYCTRSSKDNNQYYYNLIAQNGKSKRTLVSIPVGQGEGMDLNTIWLTDHYLYFYLVGNEQLNTAQIKTFAAANYIEKITFEKGKYEDYYESQHKYVASGIKLFRFNIQTGKFSNTGFVLHNMTYAISQDDTLICVVRVTTPRNAENFEHIDIYNLKDGTCLKKDILKGVSDQCKYALKFDLFADGGHTQKTCSEFEWTGAVFGDVSPSFAGTINWNTFSYDWIKLDINKENYYVSDGPLNVRSEPGLTGAKEGFQLKKGEGVFVTEKDKTEVIDGITAPWVRIWTITGYTGWVFSGYLNKMDKNALKDIKEELYEKQYAWDHQ